MGSVQYEEAEEIWLKKDFDSVDTVARLVFVWYLGELYEKDDDKELSEKYKKIVKNAFDSLSKELKEEYPDVYDKVQDFHEKKLKKKENSLNNRRENKQRLL